MPAPQTMFDGVHPHAISYVTPEQSLQVAYDALTPGMALGLKAGLYQQNLRYNKTNTTPDKPIWVFSADGPHAARIVPLNQAADQAAIAAWNISNHATIGLHITDAPRGIFYGSSAPYGQVKSQNMLVLGVLLERIAEDGIKVSCVDNAQAIANTVRYAKEEAIDYLGVNGGRIALNDVGFGSTTSAAIFVKGGSEGVIIEDNYAHDMSAGNGICVGGQTGTANFRDGFFAALDARGELHYEAKAVIARRNMVERIAKLALQFKGAALSQALDNLLNGKVGYYAAIGILDGWSSAVPRMWSHDLEIAGNVLADNFKIIIHDGNDNNINIHDNPSVATPPSAVTAEMLAGFETTRKTYIVNPALPPIEVPPASGGDLQALYDALLIERDGLVASNKQLQVQLDAQKAEVARLTALLADAGSSEEAAALRAQLAEAQADLDAATTAINAIRSIVVAFDARP